MRLPELNQHRVRTSDLARGHWAVIYGSTLPQVKQSHQKHQPCPYCGGRDRFRLFADWQERGSAICGQCQSEGADGFEWLGKITGQPFAEVCRLVESILGVNPETIQVNRARLEQERKARDEATRLQMESAAKRNSQTIHSIMGGAVPLVSDYREPFKPGLSYLRNRGLSELIERGDLPNNWLGHPSLKYDQNQAFPALVAPVVVNGQPMALHRTYLTPDGHKAPVENPKKLTPAIRPGATTGGAVRLYWPPGKELAVTEGIETALAIRMACPYLAVWACVNANGLKSVLIPESVERVYIAADHDRSGTGQGAAKSLHNRLEVEGIKSAIILPPAPSEGSKGVDWLDVAQEAVA